MTYIYIIIYVIFCRKYRMTVFTEISKKIYGLVLCITDWTYSVCRKIKHALAVYSYIIYTYILLYIISVRCLAIYIGNNSALRLYVSVIGTYMFLCFFFLYIKVSISIHQQNQTLCYRLKFNDFWKLWF